MLIILVTQTSKLFLLERTHVHEVWLRSNIYRNLNHFFLPAARHILETHNVSKTVFHIIHFRSNTLRQLLNLLQHDKKPTPILASSPCIRRSPEDIIIHAHDIRKTLFHTLPLRTNMYIRLLGVVQPPQTIADLCFACWCDFLPARDTATTEPWYSCVWYFCSSSYMYLYQLPPCINFPV